jgi:hypothetical protein
MMIEASSTSISWPASMIARPGEQERRDRRAEACLINEDGMGEIPSGRARQGSRASSGSRTEAFAAGRYAQSQVA